jgi:hypothetical protein
VDVRGSPDCGQVTWALRGENHAHDPVNIDLWKSERNKSYPAKNLQLKEKAETKRGGL